MRTVVGIIGALWWLSVALLLVLRWVDGGVLIVVLQCALPIAGASLVVLLAVSVLIRHRILTALTAALAAPLIALAWPWWFQDDLAAASDQDTVVLASNIWFGKGDISAVDDAVHALGADALVLIEITPQALAQVEASGIPQALPYRSGRPHPDASGTMVFTARPHTPVADTPDFFFDQVVVEVEGEGDSASPWVLFGAHPVPPTLPQWSDELGKLAAWQERADPDIPVVMAGDFNASSGHPAFRRLEENLLDTHRRSAAGWVRTWPREGLIMPFVHLDHVLTRGFDVVDTGRRVIPGADHEAVWARLSR